MLLFPCFDIHSLVCQALVLQVTMLRINGGGVSAQLETEILPQPHCDGDET